MNCGLTHEYTIKEISEKIKKIVEFEGKVIFDSTKPEGVKRRAMDSSKFNELIQFDNRTSLEEGLSEIYECYLEEINEKNK